MDSTFLREQRAKLEQEKLRLQKEIDKKSIFPESGNSDDDREQEISQLEDNQATETSLETEQENVLAALGRIADGSYGKCIKCGGDIPEDRLRAYPAADDCVQCSTRK